LRSFARFMAALIPFDNIYLHALRKNSCQGQWSEGKNRGCEAHLVSTPVKQGTGQKDAKARRIRMLYCADGGLEFGHSKSYLGHRVSEMLYLRPRANRRRMMTASIPLCPAYPPSSKASHLTSWAAAAARSKPGPLADSCLVAGIQTRFSRTENEH
jgi:hypothetical protein